jgi:hypothetical protein
MDENFLFNLNGRLEYMADQEFSLPWLRQIDRAVLKPPELPFQKNCEIDIVLCGDVCPKKKGGKLWGEILQDGLVKCR